MTNQTPRFRGAAWSNLRRPGFWSRLSPIQRVGLLAASLLVPCCGGTALVGYFADDPKPITTADPVAKQLAGERIVTSAPLAAETQPPAEVADAAATPRALPTSTRRPATTTRMVTRRAAIPFPTRAIEDDTLAKGKSRVRTQGVAGVKTLTFAVTVAGGKETGRKLVGTVVTKLPVTKVVLVGTKTEPTGGNCDPNYTPCVPIASDVDCAGGGGNGPEYVQGPIQVIGSDPYDLDRDGDGTACD